MSETVLVAGLMAVHTIWINRREPVWCVLIQNFAAFCSRGSGWASSLFFVFVFFLPIGILIISFGELVEIVGVEVVVVVVVVVMAVFLKDRSRSQTHSAVFFAVGEYGDLEARSRCSDLEA